MIFFLDEGAGERSAKRTAEKPKEVRINIKRTSSAAFDYGSALGLYSGRN
jgi:hypothetical protein